MGSERQLALGQVSFDGISGFEVGQLLIAFLVKLLHHAVRRGFSGAGFPESNAPLPQRIADVDEPLWKGISGTGLPDQR